MNLIEAARGECAQTMTREQYGEAARKLDKILPIQHVIGGTFNNERGYRLYVAIKLVWPMPVPQLVRPRRLSPADQTARWIEAGC